MFCVSQVFGEAVTEEKRGGASAEEYVAKSLSKFVATVTMMLNVTPAMAYRTVDDPGDDARKHPTRRVRSGGTLGISFPLVAWYNPA